MPQSSLQTEFAERLITLSTGVAGLRGAMHINAKAPADLPEADKAKPILDFIASDDTLDRYDEVIDAAGWKLDNYRRNPVFQNSHKYGDIIFTLGKSLVTEVRATEGRSALYQRVEFATDINPMAKICYGLYKGGFLSAVSVGFVPIRWEVGSQDAPYRRKYLEQELLELSSVAVPANPNALVMGLKSGAIEATDLREVLDLAKKALSDQTDPADPTDSKAIDALLATSKQFFAASASPGTHASASSAGTHEAQLLHLARTLSAVLKGA